MHYHLDPVGGIAGDMFAAAMLDYHRDWQEALTAAINDSGLSADLAVRAHAHNDGILAGHRFAVQEPEAGEHQHAHHHRHWREIRELLSSSRLDDSVKGRAIAIFELLAEAEAEVHGKAIDAVAFHEVGAWDSIADIVSAAWLIERSRATSWSCSTIPLGRGRVASAHGQLPIPAPATSLLLRGFPVFDDGVEGERVTPTGAAILKYLQPRFGARTGPSVLLGHGYGFGTKTFPGFSNVLQVSVFDPGPAGADTGTIAVCEFEVDDQTPEDLAVALDQLRATPGVLDVLQMPVFGKKGRLGAHVQLLADIPRIDAIIDRCLIETTSLGVRWHMVNRRTLAREESSHTLTGGDVRVKRASRPDGILTHKAEMADLAGASGGHAGRERRRHEASALDASGDVLDKTEPEQ